MTDTSKTALFWAPRALSILLILFISMFALDVFGENLGFWRTFVALSMHLVPSCILVVALALAWKWEWVGAAAYAALGTFHIVTLLRRPMPPLHIKLVWMAMFALPAFVIAVLFMVFCLKLDTFRARG